MTDLTPEIAAMIEKARAEERERCAVVAEQRWSMWATLEIPPECDVTACEEIAAAIRALGNPEEG